MISADTNLFVHAANRDSPLCLRAIEFFEKYRTDVEFVLSEFVLVELYMCLRNPSIMRTPLGAKAAVTYCEALRSNPSWQVVGTCEEVREDLWMHAARAGFPFRRIIDARLALSLKFSGVTEFATINTKDFEEFGFSKVWNPLAA